jgi:hypothetical protein
VKVFGCSQDGSKTLSDLMARAQQAIERARGLHGRTNPILDRLPSGRKPGFTFLVTDSNLGMTFARIASQALDGSAKRTRNQANARRAYDSISAISQRAFLTGGEREDVDAKLGQLRCRLEMLGEVFR